MGMMGVPGPRPNWLLPKKYWTAFLYPTILHTTLAAFMLKPSSQTVPHDPPCMETSTLPSQGCMPSVNLARILAGGLVVGSPVVGGKVVAVVVGCVVVGCTVVGCVVFGGRVVVSSGFAVVGFEVVVVVAAIVVGSIVVASMFVIGLLVLVSLLLGRPWPHVIKMKMKY